MIDPVEFGRQMASIVREATGPLLERIDALEKELVDIPEPVAPVEIDIDAIAKEAASLIPAPKDGDSLVELKSHLSELVKQIKTPTVDEVAAVFERRFSDLTLSWERQARDVFDKAADRMPVPKDGRDAIPLDSFDLTLSEDSRTLTVKMQAADGVVEKSIRVASIIDRGIYKAAGDYEKGDAVTHGGCLWIAQQDAPEGAPGMGGKGWRLAVKKGRDGKDLRDNASTADTTKGVSVK